MDTDKVTFADPLESWRPVVGFEGIYEVSDRGRVRRVGHAARTGAGRGGGARIGRLLRQNTVSGGYYVVQLWRDGKPKTSLVSRLVAAAFLGVSDLDVNHKSGIKADNTLKNLEYMTAADNNLHAYRTGLRRVTVEQMARARRKKRTLVACACGCGEQIETPNKWGRDRRFISGHNGHGRFA